MFIRIWFVVLLAASGIAPIHAEVVFVYEGACTDINRADCAAFGLQPGDEVKGFINVATEFGEPGAISNLTAEQYDFGFEFGQYTFSQQGALGVFSFLVSGDGMRITSMLGSYRSHENPDIVLALLTPSTVQIARGRRFTPGFTRADTFGDGAAWELGDNSDIFTPPAEVPLPASAGLLLIGMLVMRCKTNCR